MHLVDTTVFFAPHSGGVKRYLMAKRTFLAEVRGVRHSLVIPGPATRSGGGGLIEVASARIPFGAGYRAPLRLREWEAVLCDLQPDVIEVGDPYQPAWAALACGQRLGVPVVAFAHSDLSRLLGSVMGRAGVRCGDNYLRKLYARFDLVISPSRMGARRLRYIGLDRVAQQSLGVDDQLFHPDRRDANLRHELGLTPATRLLVFAGRMAREKRIGMLRRAFDDLGSPYHLLLVGGDKDERLSSQVTMLRYQHDGARLARLLASADALVHAGPHETFGMIVLEAMACGRPVVATHSGALVELIDPTVGVLATPGGLGALKRAIVGLYERDLDAMGREARRRIETRYTWRQTFAEQICRYSALTQRQTVAWGAGAEAGHVS